MELSLPYLAGFFDGEGSVGVYANGAGIYHLRTQLTQRAAPDTVFLLDTFQDRFGGNVSRMNRSVDERRRNVQPGINWQLNNGGAAVFLEAILPYLILKRVQAEIAVAWHRRRPIPTRDEKGRQMGYPRAVIERDAKVSRLIKALKTQPIDAVMAAQIDLVEIVHELRQVLCVKG